MVRLVAGHFAYLSEVLLTALFVILAMPGAAPAQTASPSPCQQFASGYRDFTANHPQAAVPSLAAASHECRGLADYSFYYLGLAQRDIGKLDASTESLNRLVTGYPQSVLASLGMLALGQVQFRLGRYADAAHNARQAIGTTSDPAVAADAMFLLGNASEAIGDYPGAYREFQELRASYPESSADKSARTAAYAILAAHPGVTDTANPNYHRHEGELLLREGDSAAARIQIKVALQFMQPPGGRAGLLWLLARAERDDSQLEQATILDCLGAGPAGTIEAAARDRLGHLYWRADDTENARRQFEIVADKFPGSDLAPEAILAIGKSYADDHRYDAARGAFQRLLEHYPDSDQAAQARFLIPWSFFMTGHYADAARSFTQMGARTSSAADRDMSSYWLARSLALNGDAGGADAIYRRLAASTTSNYYPALAAQRIGAAPPVVIVPKLPFDQSGVPSVAEPSARFHLDRAIDLRGLGLNQLEAAELRALEPAAGANSNLRSYLLGAMQAAGAWYDALVAATRFQKQGHLSASDSERLRYPLAFPDLIVPTARQAAVEPYLVMSLTRQESLFDPNARSVSDARGLMQLLPTTAARMAKSRGIADEALNLYDPVMNVRLGVTYLGNLLAMYDHNRFKAVAAYNAGEHAVDRWNAQVAGPDDVWVENIGFRETRDYVKKVIGGLREYEILYGRSGG